MIPPSSWCRAYLIYSLFHCEFEVVFAWIVKKLVFLVQILWILKLRFEDWPLWKDFYKSSPFVQRTACVRLLKEHLFCSNNTPEIHVFNFWRHQKLLVVAKQLQDSTLFIFENNCDGIDIRKLVSQLKVLPSLFELKGTLMQIWKSPYMFVFI